MGFTRKERNELDKQINNLIKLTDKYQKDYDDDAFFEREEKTKRRFKTIKSKLISLKVKLHLEYKDTKENKLDKRLKHGIKKKKR